MVHVPYRGSAAAYPDLMTGKVHVLFDNLPGSVEFVRSGKLRALGVTTAARSDALPDVPAVGETVPGYEASVFYGISAPKGTPPEAIEVLNKAITAALGRPEDESAHRRARRHADADVAGRIRQAGEGGNGEMGRGGEGRGHLGRLTAVANARRARPAEVGFARLRPVPNDRFGPRYFFTCLRRKSMVRCHAVLALASWKLPRSSQWKPCWASG